MNTTPSISKYPDYTVVGGTGGERETRHTPLFSVIVLNRGGRYRRGDLFARLEKLGASDIISVEGETPQYDVEQLTASFPKVRFMLLHRSMNIGHRINIGMSELKTRYVLVIWNDMTVDGTLAARSIDRMRDEELLCMVPIIRNERGETVPSIMAPAFFRRLLRVVPKTPIVDEEVTLFPFDYCGFYHRERFLQLHGFDTHIERPYWQKLDFGFRAFMWGEQIRTNSTVRAQQLSQTEPDDTTPDLGYRRLYLKALAVRFQGDYGILPWRRFPGFVLRSGAGVVGSLQLFREIRRWVYENRFRFRQNARSVTDLWEYEE